MADHGLKKSAGLWRRTILLFYCITLVAWNWICRASQPQTPGSACFLSAQIKGVSYHTWPVRRNFKTQLIYMTCSIDRMPYHYSPWDNQCETLLQTAKCCIQLKKYICSWVWWYLSVIPAPRRLRHKGREFKASMGYIVGSYLIKQQKQTKVVKSNFNYIV